MFFIARDTENSILESRYGEIVRTSDPEYLNLAQAITAETVRHRDSLSKKIEQLTKNKLL